MGAPPHNSKASSGGPIATATNKREATDPTKSEPTTGSSLSSQRTPRAHGAGMLNPEDHDDVDSTRQISPTTIADTPNARGDTARNAPDRAADPCQMGEDNGSLTRTVASKGESLLVLEEAVDDGSVVKTAGTLFFTALEVSSSV